MNSSFHIAGALLFTALTLGACGKGDAGSAKAAVNAAPRQVTVARVEPRTLSGGIAASGVFVSREEAAVAAEVTGFRVARVMAEVGDRVAAGQPLVQLDDTLLRSQVDQQQALVAQAEVAAKQAEAQAARVAGLEGSGVLSQEQIEDRRFQAQSSRAQANAQAAGLRDLRARQAKMTVRSPVAGVVFERTVRPGDLSGGAASPMFRIIRDGLVELDAQVAESEIVNIRPGQPAQVTLPSGRTIQGTVRLIEPNVDPQTKLGSVLVALPVSNDLRPGGFGRAVFGQSSASALTVPESALRYDADGVSVMVVGEGDKVAKQIVRVGRRGGGYVELVQGPPAGSRVLLGAASFVLEGDVVKPVDGKAVAAPSQAKAGAR